VKAARRALVAVSGLALGYLLFAAAVGPSNDRTWSADQALLPQAVIDGDRVTIRHVRNFTYRSTADYDVRYEDRVVDLARLDSVWFVVEPFGPREGPAHTFLSFGFGPDAYLAISVEIRKEKGESFSPLMGLLRRYEVMYVIGDERDLVGLRANHRKDDVYLYPIRTTPEKMRELFLGMLDRANRLAAEPEFYNTLTNTCTTNIVRHVNAIAPGRVPFRLAILLPGYSDRLAYELGLIDTNLPFAEAKERFRINEKARRHADAPDFSRRIREP
jgi:hypothetical protein